ncbi:hypothetical protein LTR67_000421 [Exophiala xenobiotica]|jgi:hypothetical protein
MPNGTYFQSVSAIPTPPPTSPPYSSTSKTATATAAAASASASDFAAPNDATSKLTEAIDDFLGDLEKKFKGISDEILTKRTDNPPPSPDFFLVHWMHKPLTDTFFDA